MDPLTWLVVGFMTVTGKIGSAIKCGRGHDLEHTSTIAWGRYPARPFSWCRRCHVQIEADGKEWYPK